MDQGHADYDEPDPPTWPGFLSALAWPFLMATALVGVGIGVGLVISASVTR
jgi:hypothetical protein